MSKIPLSFYQRQDVVQISRELLGKYLFTRIDGVLTGGMIVETEAYNGRTDKACHSFGGRRTPRTEIMYQAGGVAYVYLTYGIHYLFNIVTNDEGQADAVLIRGIEPVEGLEIMMDRRGLEKPEKRLSAGPGVLSQALGIGRDHYGLPLNGNIIWLEDRQTIIEEKEILARPRVGIAYAEEDALLPWRFSILNNPWVSKTETNYGDRTHRTKKK
ncbi:DNA-3-methyladenine glycosylase [Nafulsella turpanensis]|uniref:DNA-3-methyladenine glycosylase n=1 Tax=Nafulsella turpanensis TaxID=1265690 RepID=UPI0003748EE3|nr:DNA-3-methyladenine glycosylase [Nafulsella turpanensis]